MSHRRAKKLRNALGVSGEMMRDMTEYQIIIPFKGDLLKRNKHERGVLVLAPGCPRSVYQRAKQYVNR